jgi:hypothetical protein
MTFTEAALEVLRSAAEPLHYKKITELAIARNLLSHVGKTPEVTMSSRLATLVKKDRGQSGIVKVRPGVFAVRESHMPSENEPQPTAAAEPSTELEAPVVSTPARAARPPMPGADVFPEEEGDDDPILAGVEGDSAAGQDERGRRRRRRRRRGKGGEGDELPIEARGPRPEEAGPRVSGPPPRERERHGRDDRGRDVRGDDRGRNDRGRDVRRDDRGRDDRPRERDDRNRDHGRREERPELDLSRQPGDGDLLGKDLADAAYSVLARGDRSPASFARVADMLVRRGRLSGSAEALAPTVAAALRGDAARAQRAHARPRFRLIDQRVSLTEWLLPRDVVRCEENVEGAAEQQRDQVRRAFVNRLNDLPTAGFAELIATWLNAEGVMALRAVRRPGSSGRELHLAGTLKRGAEETRLAVVVLRSGRDVDRELVVEVRGSMHHYGGATSAWLVTTARVAAGAREEGAAEHATPCALHSGQDLARSMERLGIGLRQHFIPLCDIDLTCSKRWAMRGCVASATCAKTRARAARTKVAIAVATHAAATKSKHQRQPPRRARIEPRAAPLWTCSTWKPLKRAGSRRTRAAGMRTRKKRALKLLLKLLRPRTPAAKLPRQPRARKTPSSISIATATNRSKSSTTARRTRTATKTVKTTSPMKATTRATKATTTSPKTKKKTEPTARSAFRLFQCGAAAFAATRNGASRSGSRAVPNPRCRTLSAARVRRASV